MQTNRLKNRIALLLALSSLVTAARAADYPSTVNSLGPVAYYRLSETTPTPNNIASNSGTAGAIGNGFYVGDDITGVAPMHGALQGALVASTNPCVSTSPGWMQVPIDPAINPPGAFTAEAWIQPTAAPSGLTCFMTYGHLQNPANAPNRSGWLLYQDNGGSSAGSGFNFRMYNHVGINRSITLTGGDVPVMGSWYHVAVSYDGTNAYLYFNGKEVASGLAPGYVPSVDGNFSIGLRNDLAFPYIGLVDEVALYTNALDPSVILSHYQNGTNAAPTTAYETLIANSSPLLYYRFDEPPFIGPSSLPTTANLGSGGSSLDATIDNGVVLGSPGVPYAGFETTNKAPRFNGLIGSVIISNPPASLNGGNVTFTAWVKRLGPADDIQGWLNGGFAGIIYQRNGSGTATGLSFGDSNDLRYNYNDVAGAYNFAPGLVLPDQTWSFVAGVFTANQTVLCLNGALATNSLANAAHDFTSGAAGPLFIGLDPTGNRVVNGYIDEVAIFDKALTPAQLQQLFAAGSMPPIITSQPQGPSGTIYEGFNISFSVAATGGLPLSYQWRKSGVNLSGQTQTTFAKNNVVAGDTGNYDVVVSNPFASVTSSVVALTVLASPPILTALPVSVTRYPGGTASFSTAALGTTPITYQWLKGTNAIPGETNTTLTIKQLQASDVAAYSVVASNPLGSSNSPAATVSLLALGPNSVDAILSRGPIAFWRLNETNGTVAFDSVGGFDGTFNPVTTHSGFAGPQPPSFTGLETNNTAYSFDGNTSDINCPALNVSVSTLTIVAFIQPQGLPNPTDPPGLVVARDGTAEANWAGLDFRNVSGNLGYNWKGTPWDSTLLPITNQWNFVALVVETNQATVYLDPGTGLQTAVNPSTNGPITLSGSLHLGSDPIGNRLYGGLLDEVAIFDHALTQAEITAIHDAAYKNTYSPVVASITVQPVSQTLFVGDSFTLSSGAAGTPPLTYQWTKNGANVPGAIRDTLTVNNISASDAGVYSLVVTQGSTTIASTPANITVLQIPSTVNLTNQLVLHLKFDGNYADSSGRTNDAAAIGAPTAIAVGKIGSAVHLDNANYLQVSDLNGDLLFDATNSFSVSLWLRYTKRFNDLPVIGNAVNSTYQRGWVLSEDGGKFEWTLTDVNNASAQTIADPVGGPQIDDGAWHNLVAIFDRDAALASSFVDGQQVDTRGIGAVGSLISGSTVTLAQDPTGAYGVTGSFDLDDLGIWRTALNPIEARSIYYAGQSGNSFDTVSTNVPPPTCSVQKVGNSWEIIYTGVLRSSSTANGTYNPVTGATSPYTIPTAAAGLQFYRSSAN